MINTKEFYKSLLDNEIDFFTGVPDSLLKNICSYISDNSPKEKHIISANEGGAIALAMGYHLATKKTPLVYMQNSGFGNTINPLLSLADPKVYSIPMILVIGWRGEPGKIDEPQHIKQGEISESLLKTLDIPYIVISSETQNIDKVISNASEYAKDNSIPYAILVKKATFEPYSLKNLKETNYDLSREDAIIKSTKLLSDSDIIVATTGKTSRELFEYRSKANQGHHRDFLTVGGMGHANQIALGIALSKKNKNIYCFDGDGAVIMHTGSLGIIGNLNAKNFKHIIFNNGAHDSVGGQPTIGFNINFSMLASNLNYNNTYRISKSDEFNKVFKEFQVSDGPSLLEILINKGARSDLGRPTISPKKNKNNFMSNLRS
tara:strand:+ start:1846 stop:2973 length:1128 start_codon:yes stop_codon:yes gene_type:complete